MTDGQLCPLCGSDDIVRNGIEFVCRRCGCVVGYEDIDFGPEWRQYEGDEDKSRVGPPRRATYIGEDNPRLQGGINYAISLASRLGIPGPVVERSAQILREAHSIGVTRGRSLKAMAAAALYLASREVDVPISIYDISSVSGFRRRIIIRYARALRDRLGLRTKPSSADTFLMKLCRSMNLWDDGIRIALKIVKAMSRIPSVGWKSPRVLAAASAYLAGKAVGAKISINKVAAFSGVSQTAIQYALLGVKATLKIDDYAELAKRLANMEGGESTLTINGEKI